MNENKTYILIDQNGFSGEYSYCPEHKAIYVRGKEDKYCLFDLLYLLTETEIDDLDKQLKICHYVLMAYETGIRNERVRITNKLTDFLK